MTDAAAFSVNVHVLVLSPPLEHAPDQIASRPFDTASVIDVPVVNDADPVLPTATLMPAGLDVTRSPLRPVAVTVNVAACPGGGGGVTVSVALFVAPPNAPAIVAVVEALTAVVVTLNAALVAPAGTMTLAGTDAVVVLLLDSVTDAPPAGAALVSVAVPCTALPPTTLDGLRVMLDKAGVAGAVCGRNVRAADHAPAAPAELIPRTRHECWTLAKPPAVNADGVTI